MDTLLIEQDRIPDGGCSGFVAPERKSRTDSGKYDASARDLSSMPHIVVVTFLNLLKLNIYAKPISVGACETRTSMNADIG